MPTNKLNRKSFLRSLFVVAVAPKVLSNINIEPNKEVTELSYGGKTYIVDLELMKPTYYNYLVKKYTNAN